MMSDLRSRSSRYEETPIDRKGKSNANDQVDNSQVKASMSISMQKYLPNM